MPAATDQAGKSRSARATKPGQAGTPAARGGGKGGRRGVSAHKSRALLWGFVGLLTALTAAWVYSGRERTVPIGAVLPNILAAPMTPVEATNTLSAVNATARVEERNGELTVRVAAAMFPEKRTGQLALAQQYARADEIVQGRKRPISFLDAAGNRFARADPEKGVAMTR